MSLIKSFTTVGFFTILSRIFGFLRDLLMATYIGAGPVMDALVIAIRIPSTLRRLFAEGAFNAAFVPLFAGTLSTEGKQEAQTYAEEVMSFLVTVIIGVIIVFELFAPFFMSFLTPGFKATPERFELALLFTRITFPYLLLISLTALYSGILNSLDRFVAAALSPAIGNIFICAVMLIAGASTNIGYIVAWALLLSGLVQFLCVLFPTSNQQIKLRFKRPGLTPRTKKFLLRMIPGAIGSGVVQINLFIGTTIASFLPIGGVSYLYYADRLNQLPLSVIGTAISTALLPLMSRQLRKGDTQAALHNQNRSLEFGLLLALPATIALILAAEPFIIVLFERGKFTPEIAHQTALTLMGYACGLPAYILIKIFATSFFSREDTKTPVLTAAVSVVVDIALSLLLFIPLKHVGIALATAGASWVNAALLAYILQKRDLLNFDSRLKRFIPKILGSSFVMALVLYIVIEHTQFLIQGNAWERITGLVLIVGSGLSVFCTSVFLTKAVNFKDFDKNPPKHEVPLP
ncbi:MAG: murein biosynthesis integral membrane protein MurJ [Alphaproteobacteria bacterium 16-39-46]|nr:MAG: murein biosynthesis integral membrane protein MurJ [Alphaproteobacteria bacterium 16-39-46]OZA43657.1 MAG: murein biosynthesis integral membrane protein MurJ [Alphaproteobacteria bacterium 17-39-52]HQS83745.1 murein biosynthesis integral membrane protein MurJ [Alphaproteobacteria bacterium]HQS93496.1 murein biosynthesis integral membrane protein MurJ [Alphaproteobacteria bacterium]